MSVIETVLSIIIAMAHGFGTVIVLAVGIYMIGVVAMFRSSNRDKSGKRMNVRLGALRPGGVEQNKVSRCSRTLRTVATASAPVR